MEQSGLNGCSELSLPGAFVWGIAMVRKRVSQREIRVVMLIGGVAVDRDLRLFVASPPATAIRALV